MPRIYRSMRVEEGKPRIANAADGLGVRCGNGPHDDVLVTQSGDVSPGTGGMSVAPGWRALPDYRIPRRLREKHRSAAGNNQLACWRMGEGSFVESVVADGLNLRIDRATHGLVEPSSKMPLSAYLQRLAATADVWVIDEE